ncbi:hypothetical protein [Georgenia alba]|uniref:Uncharacterized protein n=1 Tax=Georgenia alba TaxID=2233858 RepID=A0ABW2Q6M4_9MICO
MTDARPVALLLGAALVAAVASPVRQNWSAEKVDDFPLSYYPMFSARRRRHGRVVHVVADHADGTTRDVPYRRLGDGGFNQVRRQVAKRASSAAGADDLAREVLARLSGDLEPPVRVRVLRSTYVYDDFFAGHRAPLRSVQLGAAEPVPAATPPPAHVVPAAPAASAAPAGPAAPVVPGGDHDERKAG